MRREIVATILAWSFVVSPTYADSCRDHQFRFEKIVKPFGEGVTKIRESFFRTKTLTSQLPRIDNVPPWSGEVLRDINQTLWGLGVSLGAFPPWYATKAPTAREFLYDVSRSASAIATESWTALEKMYQFVQTTPLDQSFMNEKNLMMGATRSIQQASYGLAHHFGFLPIHVSKLQTPVGRILSEQFRNPSFQPSATDIATLKQYNMYESFMKRQKFKGDHPVAVRVRYGLDVALRSALFASAVAALNNLFFQMETGAVVTDHEFLLSGRHSPDQEQVQLIVDMVPFPHLAVRIGNEIYSYGYTHLTKLSDAEYVRMRKLREVQFDPGIQVQEKKDAVRQQGSLQKLSYNATNELTRNLRLDQLPLSMQVVTLNLGLEEKRRVRQELESHLGKRYINETGVNDCATMVMRALDMENQLIDASPSQVVMWFAMQKRLGSEVVDSVFTVMVEDTDNPGHHVRRNFAINLVESYLFVRLFVFNQAHRAYVDTRYSAEELQFYSPETQKVLKAYEESAMALLQEDQMFYKFKLRGERIRAAGSAEDKAAFQRDVVAYVQNLKSEDQKTLQAAQSDLLAQILAEYRLRIIDDYAKEFLR